ncbi:MAG: xanthine dehydrogenase family protein subunit M [Anaerolineae bacterium]|nr:xanthine dehydrogenase family protein subunit M [Anaerolineales bacterium]MCQ3978242.1 xanthine dehydrogenase family protein subunit M [Anaerolineae bacterium]
MKPPPFEYFAPTTTAEALALLSQYGYEAKPLAGGQSLIPTMNFRLAQPGVLIDLNPIAELAYIHRGDEGGLRIGAMTRQRQVERDPLVAEHAPLLRETMPYIAHPQIRNRGTFGGSLAHADPAAELPAVTTALDARFRARSQAGERWIPAHEFFVSLFATALEPDELLVEVALPPLTPRTGWAFTEMARRHGDYALVGVAAVVTLDERDQCRAAKLVFLSVGDGPVEAQQAAQLLIGQTPSAEAIRAAAETAATNDITPNGDIHASAEFRRHLARVLVQRVLTQAVERAKERR